MAAMQFRGLQLVCNETDLIIWRPHAPPTRLSGFGGVSVSPATLNLNVGDHVPPALSGCPTTLVVVDCSEVPPPATVTATDNCDPLPQINYTEVRTDWPGPDMYTLARTWTAADFCGNLSICEQIIYVQGSCLGACCQPDDGTCSVTAEIECPQPGLWHADWQSCDLNPCPCPLMGDLNASTAVDGLDIQGFVDCLMGSGTNCRCGDFNGNGLVDLGDVTDFVAALLQ